MKKIHARRVALKYSCTGLKNKAQNFPLRSLTFLMARPLGQRLYKCHNTENSLRCLLRQSTLHHLVSLLQGVLNWVSGKYYQKQPCDGLFPRGLKIVCFITSKKRNKLDRIGFQRFPEKRNFLTALECQSYSDLAKQ